MKPQRAVVVYQEKSLIIPIHPCKSCGMLAVMSLGELLLVRAYWWNHFSVTLSVSGSNPSQRRLEMICVRCCLEATTSSCFALGSLSSFESIHVRVVACWSPCLSKDCYLCPRIGGPISVRPMIHQCKSCGMFVVVSVGGLLLQPTYWWNHFSATLIVSGSNLSQRRIGVICVQCCHESTRVVACWSPCLSEDCCLCPRIGGPISVVRPMIHQCKSCGMFVVVSVGGLLLQPAY